MAKSDENFERFANGKLTQGERRVLMTHWIGEAWTQIGLQPYETIRARAFEAMWSV